MPSDRASECVGQPATIIMHQASCDYRPDVNGSPTFCNEPPFPNHHFTMVVWGQDWSDLDGQCIAVSGLVTEYRGLPQIEATSRDQVQPCPATKVIKVIDGDTIVVQGGAQVRYLGIDTPETVHPTKAVECFGPGATARNAELVQGLSVYLEADREDHDAYGRLLRYVYVDGVLVNLVLVEEGYAYASWFDPDIRLMQEIADTERAARDAGAGLWSACQR